VDGSTGPAGSGATGPTGAASNVTGPTGPIGPTGSGTGSGAFDLTLVLHNNTASQSDVVFGAFNFDPTDFSGATDIRFKATGYVTLGTLTGTVILYNVTDSTTAATLTFTSVTLGEQISATLSLPSSNKIYEMRLKVTGGGGLGSSDLIVCEWAGMQIR
jgi:hypothetical protein